MASRTATNPTPTAVGAARPEMKDPVKVILVAGVDFLDQRAGADFGTKRGFRGMCERRMAPPFWTSLTDTPIVFVLLDVLRGTVETTKPGLAGTPSSLQPDGAKHDPVTKAHYQRQELLPSPGNILSI